MPNKTVAPPEYTDTEELLEFSLLINNLKSMRRRTLEDMLSPDLPADRIRENVWQILAVRREMISRRKEWRKLPALWLTELSALPLLMGWTRRVPRWWIGA